MYCLNFLGSIIFQSHIFSKNLDQNFKDEKFLMETFLCIKLEYELFNESNTLSIKWMNSVS